MQRVPRLTVHHPTSVEEALEFLAGGSDVRVLGGGTDLVPALKMGLVRPRALVSLRALPLGGIEVTAQGATCGAGTTLWDLERQELTAPLAALGEAVRSVAAPPIRSTATVGGNLCLDTRCVFYNQSAFWRSGRPACFKAGGAVCHVAPGGSRCHACHQADLAPALIALGAHATLRSAGAERTLPLEQLYSGDGAAPLTLAAGELLCSVAIPGLPAGSGSAYQKLRTRKGLDFPAVSAAACLERGEDGACAAARVVLGAVGSAPVRVPAAEAALVGSRLEDAALAEAAEACVAAAKPVKNVDLTPVYRRKMAGVMAQRVAVAAWRRAAGAAEE